MSTHPRPLLARTAATVVAATVGIGGMVVAPGQSAAEVKAGTYTSTTISSSGAVLLSRTAHVRGDYLVLIGRYRIHPTARGGWVDLFPGHRVFMNRDGHGGYRGPAYLGGVRIGSITLTPRR